MAGRIPQPWYRASKRAWYVHHQGKQVFLAKGKEEAHRRFHELLAGATPPAPPPAPAPAVAVPCLTFDELAQTYLIAFAKRAGERTVANARQGLKPIRAAVGATPADRVRKAAVEAALPPTWGPSTVNHVLTRVLAIFNWAVEPEVLSVNPLKGLRKPRARSRGEQAVVADDDFARLVATAPPYLADILTVLHQTGARPCEVLTVTASDLELGQGVWLLREHKAARSTGEVRVVFLTTPVADICRRLAALHPSGPIFRTAQDKVFPPAYYLPRLVRELRRKIGLPESVIPYGLRHTFATDVLAAGVPDAQVAELLGHKGTAMLHRHYAHLGARAAVLKAAIGKVRG